MERQEDTGDRTDASLRGTYWLRTEGVYVVHTISVEERNGEYRFVCSCGVAGNWYGTSGMAMSTGLGHKTSAEGEPNVQRGGSDDLYVGY